MNTLVFSHGSHDCGLFTLKAIEYWDGSWLPKIIGSSEVNLRKQVLHEWITIRANQADWKSTLCQGSETK